MVHDKIVNLWVNQAKRLGKQQNGGKDGEKKNLGRGDRNRAAELNGKAQKFRMTDEERRAYNKALREAQKKTVQEDAVRDDMSTAVNSLDGTASIGTKPQLSDEPGSTDPADARPSPATSRDAAETTGCTGPKLTTNEVMPIGENTKIERRRKTKRKDRDECDGGDGANVIKPRKAKAKA